MVVFMALVILISSHAYAYYKHTCLITQKESISLKLKTCFGNFIPEKETASKFKKASCCKIEHLIKKVDNRDNAQSLDFTFSGYFVIPEFGYQFLNFSYLVSQKAVHYFSDSSPPLFRLFIRYCVFLI